MNYDSNYHVIYKNNNPLPMTGDKEQVLKIKYSKLVGRVYDLYKMDWIENNVSKDEYYGMVRRYEWLTRDSLAQKRKYDKFEKYLEENQFSSGIYMKRAEFEKTKFLDGDYVMSLLEDDVKLWDIYVGMRDLRYKLKFNGGCGFDTRSHIGLGERVTHDNTSSPDKDEDDYAMSR